MNKKSKQSLLTDTYPMIVPFKTAVPRDREAAKSINYQPRVNVNSNTSTRLPFSHDKERQLEADIYQDDDSLSNQNALNFNQLERMQKARYLHFEDPPVDANSQSGTLPVGFPSKIKVDNHDDSLTSNPKFQRQTALAQEIKKQSPHQVVVIPEKKNKTVPPAPKAAPILNLMDDEPTRTKADKILLSKDLRDKFNCLLIDHDKYFIGHKHKRLMMMLDAIDNTISFIGANRGEKFMFFNDLQRSLREHQNRMEIREDHLQQLIFIDDSLYIMEWVPNKNQKYALRLQLPEINSYDKRKLEVRKKIVDYLLTLEAEYAAAKNIPNLIIGQWSPGFNPDDYDIPRKSLPSHPNCKSADIKQLTDKQIDAVANPNLRKFMKGRKLEEEEKSLNSQQVSSMILMKNLKAKDIVEKAIKEKQQQIALMLQSQGVEKLEKSVVLDICTEMFMMYIATNTSYMFKDVVQGSLNRKLRYKEGKIMQSLRYILEAKQVGFIKEVQTSERPVLRMDRTKFDEMRRKIDKLM